MTKLRVLVLCSSYFTDNSNEDPTFWPNDYTIYIYIYIYSFLTVLMKNLVQYGSKELQNRELIAFLLTSFKPELGGY
jgi:hypothetical protein